MKEAYRNIDQYLILLNTITELNQDKDTKLQTYKLFCGE